jgi:glycosyltransferase involved in cell wall biosynthesis
MAKLSETDQILYISSVDISLGNGPGVNEIQFVTSLYQALGDRAHFLIPRPKSPVPDIPVNVCTFTLPHHLHNPMYFPGHVLSLMRQANQLLSHRHFDLLLFRLDLMPFAPVYITKKHHIPFALKTLGQGQMNAINAKILWPLGAILSKLNQLMVTRLVRNAIVVDTVSMLQKNYLDEILDVELDKIICIDNAVNTDHFHPIPTLEAKKELGLDQYNHIIGYAGNHADERGGTQMIKVAPKLLPKYPDLGVVILGDENGNQNLIDLAHKLGIQEHCVFTGSVPFHQVPTYINAFDVGISLLPPKYYGQSELKVRQYVSCGIPVVATTPGSNDFLGENKLGSLVNNNDIKYITDELDRWLSLNEDDRTKFSNRAFAYARDHLSVERALDRRFSLWKERIDQQKGTQKL